MVIYPVTLLRAAMGAAERVLETILETGSQESRVPEMLTRARLYELVDYGSYSRFDTSVFDFEIPEAHRTDTDRTAAHLPPETPPSTKE